MATRKKSEFSIINDKKLNIAFSAFMDSFKENEKDFLQEGGNLEDVKSLIENFRGKTAITALSTVVAVITALPMTEFLAFSSTFKSIQKAKLLDELMDKINSNGADNDIDK